MIRIDRTEIESWADKPEAPHQLPELIRKLILATVPRTSLLRIPSGSSVRLSGWDGVLEVEGGNAWVPKGTSTWEISCERGVAAKASKDYEKRTTDPLGIDPSETTLLFVSARLWKGKDSWIEQRRAEGNWHDIKFLDSVDLAAWLEQAPAVAEWFAKLIGKLPETGVEPLDEWWQTWSSMASPPLTPDLVVAGRDSQVAAVSQWLQQTANRYYVKGSTPEEAIAFLAACGKKHETGWGAELFARALVVKTPDAWRSLERHPMPLVLIRGFEEDMASSHNAVGNGHHVLTPLAKDDDPRGNGVELPSLGRDQAVVSALVAMGLSDARSREIIRKSAGRLTVLRRFLLDEAGVTPPAWATAPPSSLAALVLVGEWDEGHEGDKQAVAQIVGQAYEEIERDLPGMTKGPDAPLVKIGSRWRFVSHEEAWHLLAPHLTSTVVSRFAEVLAEVLGQASPRFKLPASEQPMATIMGKALPHSDSIREGLARNLALMGASPERATLVDSVPDVPVRLVLNSLAPGKSWEQWATLGDLLPILAEAAPEQFLDAVERDLSEDVSAVRDLFCQWGNSLSARPPYVGLMWALETLAWSKDHFSRVANIMAKLAGAGFGDDQSRAITASLTGLFLPWIRFSETPDAQRLAALRALVSRDPSVGFQLLLDLYPPGSATDRRPPSWRPWGQDGAPPVTLKECSEFVAEMDDLLLDSVGMDANRWCALVTSFSQLSPATQDRALEMLAQSIDDLRSDPSAGELWAKIRHELHRHRRYSHTVWAMSQENVGRLADCYKGLTPNDTVAANAWLFDGYVELPEPTPYLPESGVDHDLDREQVAAAQRAAMDTMYQRGGVSAVVRLAEVAKDPNRVGVVYAECVGITEALPVAHTQLQHEQPQLRQFSYAILRKLFLQEGWDGLEPVLQQVKAAGSDSDTVATVYQVDWPAGPDTWERLEREVEEVQGTYWKSVHYGIAGTQDRENVSFVAERLVAVGRSLDAAQLLAFSPATPEAITVALERLPRDLSPQELAGFHGHLGFMVAELLRRLEESGSVSEETIAGLEIPYVGLLRYDRPELALHRQMLRSPSLFADMVSWAFKRSDDQADSAVEESPRQYRAMWAFDLMRQVKGLPGQLPDGTIDQSALENWVREARRLCTERARQVIGDEQIGQLLANAPSGADGIWPCEPVRDLLDSLGSYHTGVGFTVGKLNLRGVVSKGVYGGGDQERTLAARYRADAEQLAARWPTTAKLLRELASDYDSDARLFDLDADWLEQFGK